MSGQMIDRIVIVDPSYGDRLEMTAAQIAPVWMVASVDNRGCVQTLVERPLNWQSPRERRCYDVGDTADRAANLPDLIPTLEEHHGETRGEQVSFPKSFLLQVIGLKPADSVINSLPEFGFSSFFEIADGFQACK